MSIPTRNDVIWIEKEGTYGSDPTPTNADALLTAGTPVFTPNFELIDAEEYPGTLGKYKAHLGRYWSAISFESLLRSSGAAYTGGTVPRLGKTLQGCGLVESGGSPSTFYKYNLSSDLTDHPSVTIYNYKGGGDNPTNDTVLHELNGARGTLSFSFDRGEIPRFAFNFKGLWVDSIATTWPDPHASYETTHPMAALGVVITNYPDSTNAAFLHLDFDLGSEPVMVEDAKDADGVVAFKIVKWDITGNCTIEATPAAVTALETAIKARTSNALRFVFQTPGTASEKCIITFAAARWDTYTWGDKDGIRTLSFPFRGDESAGDDGVEIRFGTAP